MLFKYHELTQLPPATPVQKTLISLARQGFVATLLLWATGASFCTTRVGLKRSSRFLAVRSAAFKNAKAGAVQKFVIPFN